MAFEHASQIVSSSANQTGYVVASTTQTRGAWSTYSLKLLQAPTGAATIAWQPGPIATPAVTDTWYARFYMYVSAAPSTATQFFEMNGTVTTTWPSVGIALRLNTDLSLSLMFNGTAQSPNSAALTAATWTLIEVRGISGSSGQAELKVAGTSVVSVSGSSGETVAWAQWGFGNSAATRNVDIFIDDFALNDSNGAAQNTWVGDSRVTMLVPTADSAVGTGWTDSGAASTNLFNSVKSIPPVGLADTTTNAGHQVRNATSNANVNYDATVQDYATGGIASGDTINVVQPFAYTGAPSTTNPKSGTLGVASNPAGSQTNLSTNPNGTSGQFISGATLAATFGVGWKPGQAASVAGDIASGSRSTGPVIRLTQVTSSNRVAMCCFMGLYVDYTPGASFIAPEPYMVRQAVQNAAFL